MFIGKYFFWIFRHLSSQFFYIKLQLKLSAIQCKYAYITFVYNNTGVFNCVLRINSEKNGHWNLEYFLRLNHGKKHYNFIETFVVAIPVSVYELRIFSKELQICNLISFRLLHACSVRPNLSFHTIKENEIKRTEHIFFFCWHTDKILLKSAVPWKINQHGTVMGLWWLFMLTIKF